MTVEEKLREQLERRIMVLDGSWGVLIQREVKGEEAYRGERFRDHPRDVAGDPDLLNITRPKVVLGIHRDYFAAGADIATTNTFTATPPAGTTDPTPATISAGTSEHDPAGHG